MMTKTKINNNQFNWRKVIIFLLILWIFSNITSFFMFGNQQEDLFGNVAVIELDGIITSMDDDSIIQSGFVNPDKIIEKIDKAENDPMIKAVVFEINSPGGSPVPTDEISQRILLMNKSSVAFVRDLSASGAYWISSSTDHILANRMSMIGSIGVIASYLSFEGLMQDYNITYNRIVSDEMKDIGSPFRKLTDKEYDFFKDYILELETEFKQHVKIQRNFSDKEIENLATGKFWTGKKALSLGLIDQLGSHKELKLYLSGLINESVDYIEYKKKESFKDILMGFSSNLGVSVGEGIGQNLFSKQEVSFS